MLSLGRKLSCALFTTAVLAVCVCAAAAQGVKRVVIIKIDGLPNYYVDRFVKERDPVTGRSRLPWIEDAFYRNGARMVNFYTRGMSLSGPSWGQLDTGQHLQIKGNVEFDRFTLHAYDYLNFFPYYVNYGLSKKADMPAVEVLDQLGIPLFSDLFPFERKYTSQQLYQRGNNWDSLAGGFVNMMPRNRDDAIDEWTLGFDLRNMVIDQNIRDIAGKVVKNPEIDYLDFFSVSFDHASHHFNDPTIRYEALKYIDRAIGAIWTAIQRSSRANETALVLVSDHGFNSEERTFSQGFNLVKLFASRAGGGHHVITKRRLMMDYAIKGVYPLVPLITTTSNDSYYLNGQSTKYPTALVDFDGNERSSIHLRENDLNMLHILLQQLRENKLNPEVKKAAIHEVFEIIGRHRTQWQKTADEMGRELDALQRWIDAERPAVSALPKKRTKDTPVRQAEANRRRAALLQIAVDQEADYHKYLQTVNNLLALDDATFNAKKVDIDRLIAPGAMGDPNTIFDLQNYVVGVSDNGLTIEASGKIDRAASFVHINYFELLHDQTARSNVQEKVGSRPIDFIATRIPRDSVELPDELRPNEDPVWLYTSEQKQALLLTRRNADGDQSYRYVPISGLHQDDSGKITFQIEGWGDGFPLRIFEDTEFAVKQADRADWLGQWHNERDWLNAVHRTEYSTAVVALNEQMDRHPLPEDVTRSSGDERLIHSLRERQRQLTEADMLIVANNHWNFDVRGFNPGGNHGSFLRVSTNSTFMIAGGRDTGIPRGLEVDAPYDGLSFMPTLLRLMGKIDDENRPSAELYQRGYRRFPGRVVREIITK